LSQLNWIRFLRNGANGNRGISWHGQQKFNYNITRYSGLPWPFILADLDSELKKAFKTKKAKSANGTGNEPTSSEEPTEDYKEYLQRF
jgi:hypothetical protein